MTDRQDEALLTLSRAAKLGDGLALSELVRAVQDLVHRLAIRMLVDPDDALEATQEVLILVVTRLSTFRGDSTFCTWVYRVAVNYLLSAKRSADKHAALTFDLFEADLQQGLVEDAALSAENTVMLNELRVSCTMAMLLCLDPPHRMAYILGDILELDHGEAASCLGISKENYRQRLSRARRSVVAFTARACGIANPNAACSCPRRLPAALGAGRLASGQTRFADAPDYSSVLNDVRNLEAELSTLKLQTTTGSLCSPTDLAPQVKQLLESYKSSGPH